MPQGIDYLKRKLNHHRPRVETRYKYYDSKYHVYNRSFTMPAQIQRMFKSTMGWTSKAVDALADRLVFREFENDNYNFNGIFKLNNADVFFDSAIKSALIASCCFIYISEDNEGFPRLQVIDAYDATGVIDPITGLLTEGYAILEKDQSDNPTVEAYFLPGVTYIYRKGIKEPTVYKSKAPAPLLVPIIYKPDAVRPFGRSRITRSGMYYQNYAKRTLERSDVTAEFYSFPQKYVVGTSQDSEKIEGWKATVSTMLEFTKDEDGDSPKLGQFNVNSMSPFIEQLRMAAALFAGETGLTLDDLGFVTDNPSSAEAIKASHETLRVMARKAQSYFGTGFLNVGYIAACVRDNVAYNRSQIYETVAKWEPVFEPDAATISAIGDGIIKINQAYPGYFGAKNLRELTGLEGEANGHIGGTTKETTRRIPEEVIVPPDSIDS